MIKQNSLFSDEGMTKSDRSLHTPGNFAKKNLLYVQEVGRLQSLQPHRCIREKLASFLFMVVLEGKGILEVSDRHYDLQKGSCALIDCMEHYEHISDKEDAWKLAWVHFNGEAARGYYDLFYRYNEGNVFVVEDVEPWDNMIGNLLDKQKARDFLTELECGELLLHILNQIIHNVSHMSVLADGSEQELADAVREYLNEHYAEDSVLSGLTGSMTADINVLDNLFHQFFGIRIDEYIDNRRLNAAKEMLRFSIKPVKEIATEVGIGDAGVLQQMFSTNEGMTAEEYRMKWAQWIR